MDWKQVSVFAIPLGIIVLAGIVWLFVRRTIRTRLAMAKQLRLDPQINDWMVVFNWSRKILYVPTIVASLLAAGFMLVCERNWVHFNEQFPGALGGVWLAVFFVNFLVDEYEMNLKILLLLTLAIAVLMLWLTLTGLMAGFLDLFRHLGVRINALGYLLIAFIFMLSVIVSWIRGLFYYVALTPNYLNIQNGPNETSEQISREAFSTRIDTGDFLERLLGFGMIIVTFADTRRSPVTILVGGIGKRARQLENIRAHLSVESVPPSIEAPENRP